MNGWLALGISAIALTAAPAGAAEGIAAPSRSKELARFIETVSRAKSQMLELLCRESTVNGFTVSLAGALDLKGLKGQVGVEHAIFYDRKAKRLKGRTYLVSLAGVGGIPPVDASIGVIAGCDADLARYAGYFATGSYSGVSLSLGLGDGLFNALGGLKEVPGQSQEDLLKKLGQASEDAASRVKAIEGMLREPGDLAFLDGFLERSLNPMNFKIPVGRAAGGGRGLLSQLVDAQARLSGREGEPSLASLLTQVGLFTEAVGNPADSARAIRTPLVMQRYGEAVETLQTLHQGVSGSNSRLFTSVGPDSPEWESDHPYRLQPSGERALDASLRPRRSQAELETYRRLDPFRGLPTDPRRFASTAPTVRVEGRDVPWDEWLKGLARASADRPRVTTGRPEFEAESTKVLEEKIGKLLDATPFSVDPRLLPVGMEGVSRGSEWSHPSLGRFAEIEYRAVAPGANGGPSDGRSPRSGSTSGARFAAELETAYYDTVTRAVLSERQLRLVTRALPDIRGLIEAAHRQSVALSDLSHLLQTKSLDFAQGKDIRQEVGGVHPIGKDEPSGVLSGCNAVNLSLANFLKYGPEVGKAAIQAATGIASSLQGFSPGIERMAVGNALKQTMQALSPAARSALSKGASGDVSTSLSYFYTPQDLRKTFGVELAGTSSESWQQTWDQLGQWEVEAPEELKWLEDPDQACGQKSTVHGQAKSHK